MNYLLREAFQNIIYDMACNSEVHCAMRANKVAATGEGAFLKEIYNRVADFQKQAGELVYNAISYSAPSASSGRLMLDLADESAGIAHKVLNDEQEAPSSNISENEGGAWKLGSGWPANPWPPFSLN